MMEYYPEVDPMEWTEELVIDYLHYLIRSKAASRSKCHMVAQSLAYFFRHVLNKPFQTPGKIYPKRAFILPSVLTRAEVGQLLSSCRTLKERAILELFYSSGLRLSELQHLKMIHIEAEQNRIKVVGGKGSRDRYTLLSKRCLATLRQYYQQCKVKPKVYLFEGQEVGKPLHQRSIQHVMVLVYQRAGLQHKTKKVHALRHTFATHLLDSGVDLHTIKELLGHSKIETTMVYLHLQTRKRNMLVSPLDVIETPENQLEMLPKGTPLL